MISDALISGISLSTLPFDAKVRFKVVIANMLHATLLILTAAQTMEVRSKRELIKYKFHFTKWGEKPASLN